MKSKSQIAAAVLQLIVVCFFFTSGCYQDYTPIREQVDSPTTLGIDEEDRLIERSETVLQQLELTDLSNVKQATKSLEQLRADDAVNNEVKIESDPLPDQRWIQKSEMPMERWEVQYVRSQPVGFLHTVVRLPEVGREDQIIIEIDGLLMSAIESENTAQVIDLMMTESPAGELISLDLKSEKGQTSSVVNAITIGEQLRITTTKAKSTQQRTVTKPKNLRGPLAVEQSLRFKPIANDEKRVFEVFDPSVSDIVFATIQAKGRSRVAMLDGDFVELTEIERVLTSKGISFTSTFWVDNEGIVQKRFTSAGSITSYSCDREYADAIADLFAVKSQKVKEVVLQSPLTVAKEAESTVFRISSTLADPFGVFLSDAHQTVRSVSAFAVDVEIQRKSIDTTSVEQSMTSTQLEPYLANSVYIQPENARVKILADRLAGPSRPATQINRLTKGLHDLMKLQSLKLPIQPAAYATLKPESDCLSQAMLLCSMARSRGLPSRVACGLTYNQNPEAPAMKFHSWVEVYKRDRWESYDPTTESGELSLMTIKVSDSAMEGQNPYRAVLQTFRVIQQIEIIIP